MANRVAEIQNRTQAAFGFILRNNFSFDFATARDNWSQNFFISLQNSQQIAFDLREQLRVKNNPVFDDFGKTCAEFAFRQSFQSLQIANNQSRLVKRADEI